MAAELPLPADELARRLNEALGRVGGVRMRVVSAGMGGTSDEPAVRFRVSVAEAGMWDVAVPMDPLDLEPGVNTSALVAVLHANLLEWWDLKDREARIARWGRAV
ncbi:hypothetical protein DZF91_21730 [Actinomadura logoneensis]|uniref:Uncharacterized protein n=1 Tax=Actinomadura logoneensis TaxID=2293572 RepID=A0A372JHS4_9ACTN|nr:hypothetical protein [Actinomadura logoneensis]RFU39561.1 hypothetical protein DZF91_21730 [Actinomadura logoneensis]